MYILILKCRNVSEYKWGCGNNVKGSIGQFCVSCGYCWMKCSWKERRDCMQCFFLFYFLVMWMQANPNRTSHWCFKKLPLETQVFQEMFKTTTNRVRDVQRDWECYKDKSIPVGSVWIRRDVRGCCEVDDCSVGEGKNRRIRVSFSQS